MPSDEDLYTMDVSVPNERPRHTLPPIRTLLATELDLDISAPYSPSKASPPPPSSTSNIFPSFERPPSQYVAAGPKFPGSASVCFYDPEHGFSFLIFYFRQKPGTRKYRERAATVSNPYYLPSPYDQHDITTTHHPHFVAVSPFFHTQSLPPTPGPSVPSPGPSEGHSHSGESSHHGQDGAVPPTPPMPNSAPTYQYSVLRQTPQGLISTPPTVRQPRRDKSGGGKITSPNKPNQGVIHPEDIALLRRHICHSCGKRFNRPSSLRTHQSVHTGWRPFKCLHPDCDKMFTVASNMRRHARKHHGVGAGAPATTDEATRTHHQSSSASSDVEMESGSGSGSGSGPATGAPPTPAPPALTGHYGMRYPWMETHASDASSSGHRMNRDKD